MEVPPGAGKPEMGSQPHLAKISMGLMEGNLEGIGSYPGVEEAEAWPGHVQRCSEQ